MLKRVHCVRLKMKNKLTNEERRKQLYFKKWGLSEKNSTGDLRQDIRNWGEEGEREKAHEHCPNANSQEHLACQQP